MKKALITLLVVLVVVPLVLVGACYGVIRYQYYETFMPGMFINGVYVANHTPQEIDQQLSEKVEIPICTIIDKEKKKYTFSMDEADYKESYLEQLTSIQKNQSVLEFVHWFLDEKAGIVEKTIESTHSYDSTKLTAFLDQTDYLADNSDPKGKVVEIRFDSNDGYYLYDETKALLSHELAVNAIQKAVKDEIYEVNLEDSDCYIAIDHTSQMKDALDMWEQLRPYVTTEITYDIVGRSKRITGAEISRMLAMDEEGNLAFDENGKIYIDEKKVKEYVKELADQLNTVGKPRTFRATRGEMITIEKCNYGTKIDEAKELEFLLGVLGSGRTYTHEPNFSQMSFTGIMTTDDIGKTYIEVDMTNQKMYYYVNGRRVLETDVVTGNTSLGRGTPVRVCFLYGKERNRTLRGEGYASFVNYWMPVYGGVGIHDASWRNKYGGTIYKTGGSHGCINTPKDKVAELYDMAEIGTPVLLYY